MRTHSDSKELETTMNLITGSAKSVVSAAITALTLILGLTQPASADAPAPRNILFIAVDDLRNWVNYGGDYAGTVHTPNIDALAAASTRYLNAYAPVPQCVGSRTSVLMGMSPANHHLTRSLWGIEPEYLAIYNNPAVVSLPQILSQNGYHTASAGKIFSVPQPARWDETGPNGTPIYNPFDAGPDNTFYTAEVLPPWQEHPDQTVTNWAKNFLATYAGTEPFFLATGLYQPHIPWRVPQWAYDLYPIDDVVVSIPPLNDLDDEPAAAVPLANASVFYGTPQYDLIDYAGKAADYTRAYLASISHTDAMVGELLAALAASPYAGNTDVIFWSDHGFHLGEKFHWGKNTFWEQSARVPLLVSAPGNPNYPVGNVTTPVSLVDLGPTVLELANLPPNPQFDGAPLHDVINRSPAEVYYNKGKATLTTGFKVVDYDVTVEQGLDDLAAYWLTYDKQEKNNVIVPLIIAILQNQ